MHFLLSNDDGYQAPGLSALAEVLSKSGKVTVVAPDRDRSGASNSLTLDRPLRIKQDSRGFNYVNGTPADCIHLAITGYMEEEPDIVISGINSSANLGYDVLYSGTVAAAMEGRFLSVPAIAFSLASNQPEDYDTAVMVVSEVVKTVMREPVDDNLILNINIPDIAYQQIRGYAITRLGNRHKSEAAQQICDPRGDKVYWIGPTGSEQDADQGTDFHAIRTGYVSITPLQVDLTRYQAMENLSMWAKGIR